MEKEVSIVIGSDGVIKMIYDDNISKTIEDIGKSTVKRASHVEPSILLDNCWSADMSPVGGEFFDGFKTRQEALDFEVSYLNKNILKIN